MRQFRIEDVFRIRHSDPKSGIVITGQMIEGNINIGDFIILPDGNNLKVLKIELFRKMVKVAGLGDNIGVLIADEACDNTKKYLCGFLKQIVTIGDLSEFRNHKLKELGI